MKLHYMRKLYKRLGDNQELLVLVPSEDIASWAALLALGRDAGLGEAHFTADTLDGLGGLCVAMDADTAEGLCRVLTRRSLRKRLLHAEPKALDVLKPTFDNLRATGHSGGRGE